MAGYPLDAIREFAALYPDEPNPIAKAEDDALEEPGIGEAIRRVDEKIAWLSRSAYAMGGPEGERQELDEERRGLVMAAHGIGTARRGDAGAKSGTLEDDSRSWPVPFETFWPIFEAAVEDGASARALEKLTDEKPEYEFVNRIKLGVLVKWVERNPKEAQRRWRVAELPPGFSATDDGVVFPNPPQPA